MTVQHGMHMHTAGEACRVGERVSQRGSVDYCAPQALQEGAVASHAMDMFSLGRLVMWLACVDGLWPDLAHGCTHSDKEAFLMSDTPFTLDGIVNTATRDIVSRLVAKHPQGRLTLAALKARSLLHVTWM